MITNSILREFVIRPSLKPLGLWCEDSEELLVATAANGSFVGSYLLDGNGSIVQIPAGVDLNIYLMSVFDYYDSLRQIFRYPRLDKLIFNSCGFSDFPPYSEIIFNMRYATIMARICYFKSDEVLPSHTDIDGILSYYNKHWNGGGNFSLDRDFFIKNYHDFIDRDKNIDNLFV